MQAPLGAAAGMRTTLPRLVLTTSAAAAVLAAPKLLSRNRGEHAAAGAAPARAQLKGAAAAAALAPAAVVSPPPPAAAAHGGGLLLTATLRLLHSVSSRVLRHLLSLGIVIDTLATWTAAVSDRVAQFADARKPVAAEAIDVGTVQHFCGQWVKVPARSEPMDAFCQLFGVPRWLRHATRLMTGMQVCLTADALVVTQVSRVGWLSTVERFPIDGSFSQHKRRDMRSGGQRGHLLSARDGRMQLQVVFQGALPGQATDTLELRRTPHGPELVVTHEASIEGRGEAQFVEVFIRPSGC